MPKGKYKRSLETRKKLSLARMGKEPWNKGKKGVYSQEVIEKMRKARLGYKFSEEERKRRSENRKGKKPFCSFAGRKHSQETINKIKEARKKQTFSPEVRKKMGAKGKNHPRWKGGITSKHNFIRKSFEYKLWREAVFKRDNWTCVWCGSKNKRLNADHIKPFSQYPELRLAIDNGRTLCVECHKKTTTFGLNNKLKNI